MELTFMRTQGRRMRRRQDGRPVVVHVIPGLNRGGAETTLVDFIKYTSHRLHNHVIYHHEMTALVADLEMLGATVERQGLSLRFPIRFLLVLMRLQPVAVIAHANLGGFVPLAVARCAAVPKRISRFHAEADNKSDAAHWRIYRSVARWVIWRSATHVLAVSRSALGFAGTGPRRLPVEARVLPNGVDLDRFAPSPTGPTDHDWRLVHIGRATPQKNRAVLPTILDELNQAGTSSWRLELYGSEDLSDLGLVRCMSPPAFIFNGGVTDDIANIIRSGFRVLLLPSIFEGQPTVILEALASGVPVVASNIPSICEMAEELVGIFTVDLGSPASKWAEAIRRASIEYPAPAIELRRQVELKGLGAREAHERWLKLLNGQYQS